MPARGRAGAARGAGGAEHTYWALESIEEEEALAVGVELRGHSIKAALVDATTGAFRRPGASTILKQANLEDVGAGLKKCARAARAPPPPPPPPAPMPRVAICLPLLPCSATSFPARPGPARPCPPPTAPSYPNSTPGDAPPLPCPDLRGPLGRWRWAGR